MIVSFLGSSSSQAVTFLPEMSSHREQDVARLNQYTELNEIFALGGEKHDMWRALLLVWHSSLCSFTMSRKNKKS